MLSKAKCKLKVKVKLSLCLTKHHAMKTYWEECRYSSTHGGEWSASRSRMNFISDTSPWETIKVQMAEAHSIGFQVK